MFATLSSRDLFRHHAGASQAEEAFETFSTMEQLAIRARMRVDDSHRRLSGGFPETRRHSGGFVEIPVSAMESPSLVDHVMCEEESTTGSANNKKLKSMMDVSVETTRRYLDSFSLENSPRKLQRRL